MAINVVAYRLRGPRLGDHDHVDAQALEVQRDDLRVFSIAQRRVFSAVITYLLDLAILDREAHRVYDVLFFFVMPWVLLEVAQAHHAS